MYEIFQDTIFKLQITKPSRMLVILCYNSLITFRRSREIIKKIVCSSNYLPSQYRKRYDFLHIRIQYFGNKIYLFFHNHASVNKVSTHFPSKKKKNSRMPYHAYHSLKFIFISLFTSMFPVSIIL